jgi:glycosyltransferase involved in cell wall biosynthesis
VKISVCMPVFGRPRMFRQALFSILAQEHEDWELVAYDGSERPQVEDPVTRQIFDLVGKDRLRYQVGPNGGAIRNFNRCFSRATGEILYAMGSDDLLSPGAFYSVSEAFEAERYPANFWLYGQTVSVDELGRRTGVDGVPTSFDEMLVHNRLGIPSVFWAKGLMGLAGLMDPRFTITADYELWLRFWRYREPSFLGRDLGVYRHHDGQDTRVHAVRVEREAEWIRVRHQFFGGEVRRARNIFQAKQAYGGEPIPGSVN